jgi:hypothetical protein
LRCHKPTAGVAVIATRPATDDTVSRLRPTVTDACPVCRTPIDGPGQPLANAVRVCPPCWTVLVRFVRRLPRAVGT